jgi:hypothetical protein
VHRQVSALIQASRRLSNTQAKHKHKQTNNQTKSVSVRSLLWLLSWPSAGLSWGDGDGPQEGC